MGDRTEKTVQLRNVPEAQDPTPTASADDAPEAVFEAWPAGGRYTLVSELARGGGGRIAIAIDRRLGRRVAIKRPLDASGEAWLEREALVLARLEHPAIVPIHDVGVDTSGAPFYTMKLLNGHDLAARIEAASTFEERLGLVPAVTTVADAIAYAHGQHVIHRDLKPSNVLVGEFGEVAVIDWGLGKVLGDADRTESSNDRPLPPVGLTAEGSVMGTPAYMAPEQASGDVVDERADVYALGAMLYHVLAGELPYGDVSTEVTLARLLVGPPPTIEERVPDVRRELAAIVNKAMARDPDARYPSAKQLAEDLHRYQTGRLVAAHRYGPMTRVWRAVRRHQLRLAIGAACCAFAATTYLFVRTRSLDQRCTGLDAPVARVWNPGARDKLTRAFAATGLSDGAAIGARVVATLDGYTTQLTAMRVDACRATRVRGDQTEQLLESRVECLDQRTNRVGALVDVLEHVDAATVRKTEQAVDSLGLVADCENPEWLRGAVPLPADPKKRDEVLAVQASLDHIRSLSALDRDVEWAKLAPEVMTRAEQAGWGPAIAGARNWYAKALVGAGDDDAAERQLEQAIEEAERSHDDVELASSLGQLVRIEIEHRHRFDLAERLIPVAIGAADRVGDPYVRTSMYVFRSRIDRQAGRAERAIQDAEAAVAIQREVHGAMLYSTERVLAEQYLQSGRYPEAERLDREVIDQLQKQNGSETSPDIATAWGGLAASAFLRGDYAHAVEYERHEIAIDDRLKETDTGNWITSHVNFAAMLHEVDGDREAVTDLAGVLAEIDRRFGARAARGAEIALALGTAREAVQDFEGAATAYRDARERAAAGSPTRADAGHKLGNLLVDRGRPVEAIAELASALELAARGDGEDAERTAQIRGDYGYALRVGGRPRDAVDQLTRAIAVFDRGSDLDDRGSYRSELARALWAIGKQAEARETAATAHELLARAGAASSHHLAEVTAWQAAHH